MKVMMVRSAAVGALLLAAAFSAEAEAACANANQSCGTAECCEKDSAGIRLYCNTAEAPPFRGPAKDGQCKRCAGSTMDERRCGSAPPTTTPTTPPPSTTAQTTPSTRPPTTTQPPSPSTTLPPLASGYEPDTWRPDYAAVSLGSAEKATHPDQGDYCDQRCLFLRIEKRAFDGWPLVIKFLRQLGLAEEVARQVNPTAGLPMVASEVGIENSGRELNMGKSWNFGPDYDWRGNVEGNLRRAREAIINESKRRSFVVPADVQLMLDIHHEGSRIVIGHPVVQARAAVARSVPKSDSALKLRGLLSAKVGCRPLTPEQERALQRTMDVHALNSEYRKRFGVGRPGGAAELMAAHEALEGLARDADELTLFTIPAFAQHIDPLYTDPAEVAALMDCEDAAHHCWGHAVRLCPANPRIFRARAWSCGNEHTRCHLFAALKAGMKLRVSVDAPLVSLGGNPPCTDRTLDRCPNLPFPFVGAGRDAGLGVIEGGR